MVVMGFATLIEGNKPMVITVIDRTVVHARGNLIVNVILLSCCAVCELDVFV